MSRRRKGSVLWTMNNTLLAIGSKRAIGEKIGLNKDLPASTGCIPPYVPVAVEAMVQRKG